MRLLVLLLCCSCASTQTQLMNAFIQECAVTRPVLDCAKEGARLYPPRKSK